IRNDSAMESHVLCVDLRNDERHMRIHSECRRLVDRNGIRLACDRDMAAGNLAAGAEESDVDFPERSGIEFLYQDRVTAELNGFYDRTRRTNRTQTCEWKTSPFQYAQQFSAGGAGRAHDGDVITSHEHVDCKAVREICR